MAVTPTTKLHQADAGYDVARVRHDFPILARELNGRPIAYLDNAATSQTPEPVVDPSTGRPLQGARPVFGRSAPGGA